MKIPQHLAELERWQGLPVPYINRLGTGEHEDDWSIRFDRTLGEVAAFMADRPGAPPDFTRQCIQRQRECVLLGLCQICKRELDWSERYLVINSVTTQTVDLQGQMVPVITEPWLCGPCAMFATTVCPSLIRRGHDEDLLVVRVPGPADCRLVLSHGWIEGRYEATTKAHPVAMWAKILVVAAEPCLLEGE